MKVKKKGQYLICVSPIDEKNNHLNIPNNQGWNKIKLYNRKTTDNTAENNIKYPADSTEKKKYPGEKKKL